MTYFAAMSGLPLRDGMFLAGDAALGFDWVTWTQWVHARPIFREVLVLAYYSLLPQIAFCIIVLAFWGPQGRNREVLVAAAVGLPITCVVFALLPALGPFAVFPLPGTMPQALLYIPHLEALRGRGPHHFAVSELQGIIVLLSYHTVLGVLVIWAHRGLRWTFIPMLILNLMMLVSVPSEGGHYITDLLAGMAAVAILAARRLVSPAAYRATTGSA